MWRLFDHNLLNERAPALSGPVWFNAENLPPAAAAKARAGENVPFADLAGYVVLVDFWTYSCAACGRSLPALREWWRKYHDQKFLVVGVHSPEFEFEKDPDNVEGAVLRFELDYPVVSDPDYATWRAYDGDVWPRQIIVDSHGIITYDHRGEGDHERQEALIISLLQKSSAKI